MPKLLVLCLVFFSHAALGQEVRVSGSVTDPDGLPLAFGSVYIENTTYGVSTDGKGRYHIVLKETPARLVFSYLGYETVVKEISNDPFEQDFSVQLSPSSTTLLEAQVVGDTRDRARSIMRQVRDKRRTYRRALDSYSSNSYTRVKLEKEKLDTAVMDSVDFTNVSQAEQFIKESLVLKERFSVIDHKAPGKYKETVTAQRDYTDRKIPPAVKTLSFSVDIDQGNITPTKVGAENPYVLWSGLYSCDFDFYDNLIAFDRVTEKPLLSPIAAQSALSYRYDYDGLVYRDKTPVHRIKVTPLFSMEALFKGVIFIEDSTFALLGVDLEVNPGSMHYCDRFRIIQDYKMEAQGVYVPMRRELDYIIPENKEKVIGKVIQIQDAYSINKDFPFAYFDGEVKRFEPEAFDRPDSLWEQRRPITMSPNDVQFIQLADSVSEYLTSDAYYAKLDSAYNHIDWWAPLIGVGHRNREKGSEWFIGGLLEQVNPIGIGGYRHRLPGRWQQRLSNDDLVELDGFVDYGFRNRDVKGRVGVGWTYRPDKAMRTYVRVGDSYELINTYASIQQIFSRSNYARSKTVFVSQRMELLNGLYGEISFDYADQIPLRDLRLSAWSNEVFGDLNEPSDFNRYTKSEVKLRMTYRIRQKYIWKRGQKEVMGTDYPILDFTYRKGLPGLFNSEVNFDYLELAADHELALARLGDLHWRASLGSFVNKKRLRLLEHRYFRGSDRFFFSDPTRSFQLLGPTLSTADAYFQVNAMHHFNGTILGKVPLLNRWKIHLAGGGGTLLLPGESFRHAEVFAGLERAIRIKGELFRVSVFAVTSDNNLERADYTLKVGINFFNTFTNRWDY